MAYTIEGTDIIVVNGEPSERILVLAQNHSHFLDWCMRQKLYSRSPRVKHVWHPDHINEYNGGWFIDLGVINRRPGSFFHQLVEDLESRGFKEIVKHVEIL